MQHARACVYVHVCVCVERVHGLFRKTNHVHKRSWTHYAWRCSNDPGIPKSVRMKQLVFNGAKLSNWACFRPEKLWSRMSFLGKNRTVFPPPQHWVAVDLQWSTWNFWDHYFCQMKVIGRLGTAEHVLLWFSATKTPGNRGVFKDDSINVLKRKDQ